MKKKGFAFALVSGILDIIFALAFFVIGIYLAFTGLIFSSNPLVNLITLGAASVMGFIFALIGLALVGLGVVFLVFGIKTLVISASKPDNYGKSTGRLLGYAITETVFFAIALAGFFTVIKESSETTVVALISLSLLAVVFVFKYVAYALAKSMRKIKTENN